MSTNSWITLAILTFSMAIIIGSLVLLRITWNRIAEKHPAHEPAEEAVCRRFQSCSVGIFNLGWSVNILADSEHLHMKPTLFLRLATSRGLSIPWADMKPGKYQFFKRYRSFKLDKHMFVAPAWAVDLAEIESC